jgi:hypothetical protein
MAAVYHGFHLNVSVLSGMASRRTLDTLLRITAVLEVDLEKIIAKARKAAVKREHRAGRPRYVLQFLY